MSMKRDLNAVWEGIGPDVMEGMGGEAANPTLTGEDVANMVGDYADTYLHGESLKQWQAATWDQKALWLGEAFPKDQKYGY